MWKLEFEKTLFSPIKEDIDIERANSIKDKNIPTKLYKFKAPSDHLLTSLENNTLRAKNVRELNDITDSFLLLKTEEIFRKSFKSFEGSFVNKYNIQEQFTDDEIDSIAQDGINLEKIIQIAEKKKLNGWDRISDPTFKEKLRQLIDNFSDIMASDFNNVILQGINVICFTNEVENELLWTHYANEQRGICIEYDFSLLPKNHPLRMYLYPILYKKSPLDITKYIIDKTNNNPLYPIHAAITKKIIYEYEKEWRVVFPINSIKNDTDILMPPISTIFIGARVSHENRMNLLDFCTQKSITLKEMYVAPREGILKKQNHSKFLTSHNCG